MGGARTRYLYTVYWSMSGHDIDSTVRNTDTACADAKYEETERALVARCGKGVERYCRRAESENGCM